MTMISNTEFIQVSSDFPKAEIFLKAHDIHCQVAFQKCITKLYSLQEDEIFSLTPC